ncbi:MAG: hypothetical protein R3F30_05750 [Planctomycetota bacterium]
MPSPLPEPQPTLRPSPRRRLERSSGPEDREALRKVFPPEDLPFRDHEARMLELAAGPGVPRLLDHGEDATTGECWLLVERVGHLDLRRLVATEGPLPSGLLLSLARQAARILARLHGLGLVHGDLKPANLALDSEDRVSLVDFEKACTTGGAAGLEERFTGGTHGYSPPEAYLGVSPDHRFDLYGFGATLHFLATGFAPRLREGGRFDTTLLYRLRPTLDDTLRLLVEALLDAQPERRPSIDDVCAALASIPEPGTAALRLERAFLGGSLDPLPGELPSTTTDRLRRCEAWGQRLDLLMRDLPHTPPELPPRDLVEGALRFARAVRLCMEHLPLLPSMRTRRQRAAGRLQGLLDRLPGEVLTLLRSRETHDGRRLARLSLDLCQILDELGLLADEDPQRLTRAVEALQSALVRLQGEEQRERRVIQRIEEAESRLDLETAQRELEVLQGPKSTRIRERLLRLRWLMARLVAGRRGLDQLLPHLPPDAAATEAATRLRAFFDRTEQELGRLEGEGDEEPAYANLSITHRLLMALAESYPKLDAAESRQALNELRVLSSRRVHALVVQLRGKLDLDPVPLKVLLRDLDECETLLGLHVLVDTPEKRRIEVLDELEDLRLRIEEVQDRNERLRRRALEKAEQGRLTTVLYDLERLLHELPQDQPAEEFLDWDLSKELEKVRRLRENIVEAARRNLELAQTWRHLSDDPRSRSEDRLACLGQREEVLQFLVEKGPRESRERYERDLVELRYEQHRERSEADERSLAEAATSAQRLRVAKARLEALRKEDRLKGARLERLVEVWRRHEEAARRELELEAEAADRERRRRAWARRILAGTAVVILAIGLRFGLPEVFGKATLDQASLQLVRVDGDSSRILALAGRTGIDEGSSRSLRLLGESLQFREEHDVLAPGGEERERAGQAVRRALERLERSLDGLEDPPLRAAIEARAARLAEGL